MGAPFWWDSILTEIYKSGKNASAKASNSRRSLAISRLACVQVHGRSFSLKGKWTLTDNLCEIDWGYDYSLTDTESRYEAASIHGTQFSVVSHEDRDPQNP